MSEDAGLDGLYQEVILDHFKRPRCHGCMKSPHAEAALYNPLCGDQLDVAVKFGARGVSEITFTGHGCSISQASASMMSEVCTGKSFEEVAEMAKAFRSMMRGEISGEQAPQLGDAVALEGVRRFSARVKCAMLAWEAIEKCVQKRPLPIA